MHNKFALLETAGERSVIFGSFNWSGPSRRFNREIGIVARDPEIFEAFAARWGFLLKEAGG
jgi:phosphatidylserine/phosphatidylglycerophosphate/cardiolipin synthase-like enzyme